MRMAALALGLIGLLGQAEPEGGSPPAPEVIRVLAIHATNEGRQVPYLGPTLSPLEEYLTALPFDTFREAGYKQVDAPYNVDTAVPVNDRYTLHCTPRDLTDSGVVVFDAHIDVAERGRNIQALAVSGRSARGQGVVFRGLSMPAGELIVVMSVAKAPAPGGGAGGGNEGNDTSDGAGGQQDAGSGGGAGGQENAGDETGDAGMPMEEPQESEPGDDTGTPPASGFDDREAPPPPDMANLEGILRALEEQDVREQEHARNRRFDVTFQGDWW